MWFQVSITEEEEKQQKISMTLKQLDDEISDLTCKKKKLQKEVIDLRNQLTETDRECDELKKVSRRFLH